MNMDLDDFMETLFKNAIAAHPKYTDLKEQSIQKSSNKRKLIEALGELPKSKVSLEPLILDVQENGSFNLEKVEYSTMEGMRVRAYLLIPKVKESTLLPAVVACHGHGVGMRDALGLLPDGSWADNPGIHRRFAIELVKRGMVVIVPEILGYGERRLNEDLEEGISEGKTSCNSLSAQLLVLGKTLAGIRVYEAIRALDYLETRAEIDMQRLGIMGFSGGGLIGSVTAAIDERVKAVVLCGYTNTFRGSILAMHHCIDNYLPGILLNMEQPDIIGLISPRPLFVESGINDPIFPLPFVEEAVNKLKEIYKQENADEKISTDLFPGGHEINGRNSFDWLKKQLME